jgi:hypothetical protein
MIPLRRFADAAAALFRLWQRDVRKDIVRPIPAPMLLLLPRTTAPISARTRFPVAAAAGEWAIAGSFRFLHRDPASLVGREAGVFKASWYGLGSFAPALHVEVAEITLDELEQAARGLAAHLLEAWNLDDATVAIETAREEIEFALALAAHPRGTRLAMEREFNEQGLIERAVVVGDAPGR